MPKLVPIVEGDGEVHAVPQLLRRLLYEDYHRYDWDIGKPKNAHGCGGLTVENGIERFVQYALLEAECAAVLVLIDGDAIRGLAEAQRLADDCAPALAKWLARRVAALQPAVPVAIVVARWEYEAWFLASFEVIARARGGFTEVGPYEGDVEEERNPKGWLESRLPPGQKYSETRDQVALTTWLDFNLVAARSRSFRRLKSALNQLFAAHERHKRGVTPL